MSLELSNIIKIASLLCTLMVIFRHSRNLIAFWGTENITNTCSFIENGVSTLTEMAVPYFFLVSGFFFFRSSYSNKADYSAMIIKKCKSLLTPYIIWNIIGFVMLWLAGSLVNDNLTSVNSLTAFFEGLLLSDYDGPLWYVRNLMMMMILAPLYGWIFQPNKPVLYGVVGIGLFLWWWPVDCAWYSSEGFLFFFLGGVIQHFPSLWEKRLPLAPLAILTCLWIVSCFFHPFWNVWVNKMTTLIGITCVWSWLTYMPNSSFKAWMLKMSSFAFFIYVTHIFVIKTMKLLIAHLYPQQEMVALLAYLGLPFITFLLLYWIGKQWCKLNPKSFLLCVGGRVKYVKYENSIL